MKSLGSPKLTPGMKPRGGDQGGRKPKGLLNPRTRYWARQVVELGVSTPREAMELRMRQLAAEGQVEAAAKIAAMLLPGAIKRKSGKRGIRASAFGKV